MLQKQNKSPADERIVNDMGKKLKWNLIVMSVLYLALGIFLLMVPGTALNVVCYALGVLALMLSSAAKATEA